MSGYCLMLPATVQHAINAVSIGIGQMSAAADSANFMVQIIDWLLTSVI